MKQLRNIIGGKLRYMREAQGKTIDDIAEATGFTVNNIRRIEEGRYSVNLDVIERIAEALDAKVYIRPNRHYENEE